MLGNILSQLGAVGIRANTAMADALRQRPIKRISSCARLIDRDVEIAFYRHNHLDDRMTVIPTEPLISGAHWHAFAPCERKMFAGCGAACRSLVRVLQISD